MKLKSILFLTLVLTIAVNAFGQKTETAKTSSLKTDGDKTAQNSKLPSAKKILKKYVAAIGGRAANEKFKTRSMKGTFELAPMGIKGTIESYAAAPDKTYTKMNMAGVGEIIDSYDGKTAWTINPIQGNRDKTGEELLQTKLISNFHRETNLEKLYPKMEVKGVEKIGDRETYVLIATPEGLAPETFYFDKQNGLLVRADLTLISPEGKMPAKTFYEDYREVDGSKMPHKIRLVLPQVEFITNITEIKNGVAVEDSVFAKPKG